MWLSARTILCICILIVTRAQWFIYQLKRRVNNNKNETTLHSNNVEKNYRKEEKKTKQNRNRFAKGISFMFIPTRFMMNKKKHICYIMLWKPTWYLRLLSLSRTQPHVIFHWMRFINIFTYNCAIFFAGHLEFDTMFNTYFFIWFRCLIDWIGPFLSHISVLLKWLHFFF